MTDEPTFCVNCENVYLPDGKVTPHFFWLCAAAQAPEKWNYVTGKREPPYRKCRDVNDGNCPMYESGPNRLNPKPMPESTPA